MDDLLLGQHLELEERHWWFVGRRRIVLNVLDRHVPERPLDVLDAGCGGGATLGHLRARYGRARGLELSKEAVAYARERDRDVTRGSIEAMPFEEESFDLALALDVIEHLPDDRPALRELRRVLKPGGRLLVTVPALMMLWGAHDEANGHHRRYTMGTLRCGVKAAGFELVTATYFNTLLFPPILAARTLQSRRPKGAASDVFEVPGLVNRALAEFFALERLVVGRGRLPVGVSALCLARKPEGSEERPGKLGV